MTTFDSKSRRSKNIQCILCLQDGQINIKQYMNVSFSSKGGGVKSYTAISVISTPVHKFEVGYWNRMPKKLRILFKLPLCMQFSYFLLMILGNARGEFGGGGSYFVIRDQWGKGHSYKYYLNVHVIEGIIIGYRNEKI